MKDRFRQILTSIVTGLLCWFGAVGILLPAGLPDTAHAEELTRDEAFSYLRPPYDLGEKVAPGVWELINLDSRVAGYGIETEPIAALPGFAGAPINLFVQITLEGKFIDAKIIEHNEPIFVSGLGQAPFHNFVTQYRGHSITDTMVVGVPYGGKSEGSSLVYLDGVTKATASVRIAHETILAAAFAVARERLSGIAKRQPTRPDLELDEDLTWDDLVERGLATRKVVTNAEVDELFKGTIWEDDDPEAKDDPDGIYLDLWVVDVGPPAIARAVLEKDTLEELDRFREISVHDEPILVIDAGRHGLVDENFIRNTSPDLIFAHQDGLPIALRDADLFVELKADIDYEVAMILRTDRRLGFDPTKPWDLSVRAVREHGMFHPEIGSQDMTVSHHTDSRFFVVDTPEAPPPPWLQAIEQRSIDLAALTLGTGGLFLVMMAGMGRFAGLPNFSQYRLAILAFVVVFVGWWGQGQLSIATVLGVIRGIYEGQSLSFLLYDPFSLLLWGLVIVSFFLWGRGLFCGWLCPFGAMQELASKVGEFLGIKQIKVPDRLDRILSKLKYVVLLAMVLAIFTAPGLNDLFIEIEPFKTAVTTYFVREWYYVAYAVGLLLISMVVFKGFCRYLCPLGAFMAIGGMLRIRKWIPRRVECGSPCQLCKVRCNYNAIDKSGAIRYSECFQCLDCVTLHDDDAQCVPLVVRSKSGRKLKSSGSGQPVPTYMGAAE
ncbi:MAG: 4Fe-4S binding protein [Pseudomonadota bacterium]